MAKIRGREQNNKISGKIVPDQGCFSMQCPWFSFRSMTKNPRYNLSTLRSGTEREQTLHGLFQRLTDLSNETWTYWLQKPKQSGVETITYDRIKFSVGDGTVLTKDTAIFVFRFDTYRGTGQGRIIGYKDSPCAVLHIIGYDLDFSAYDHGK